MDSRTVLLLIEDEPLVLEAVQMSLEESGYICLTAHDGHSGLKLIEDDLDRADVLITDVRMPGPDGWNLARHARDLNPGMPVIYMTGDSAIDWPTLGVPNSILLSKPFVNAQLTRAVTQALDAGQSHRGDTFGSA